MLLAGEKSDLEVQTREQAVGLSVLWCDEWEPCLPRAGNFEKAVLFLHQEEIMKEDERGRVMLANTSMKSRVRAVKMGWALHEG